jgi:Type I phosphodiesterase / nucleotide pyrophosphatase
VKKLVLCVIDGVAPAMLERTVEAGRAPVLARLIEDGVYVDDCVSAFPSITPVCAATIATGVAQDAHLIPNMNWYHRGEARYVEYGSSFSASRTFGIHRSLLDTIYNMNLAHLSPDVETVFESLDDAGVRTAGTTFLIYRGRHRHEIARESPIAGLIGRTLFRHGVWGPRELFYADLFASQRTGCRSTLGMPGVRDQHTGCVGSYLVEHDLFDFLLFSLPDNDTHSHKAGVEGQVDSIAAADRELARLVDAAGGMDAFLEDHAIIVMGDHSHVDVDQRISLAEALAAWKVRRPIGAEDNAEIAVCPSQRSAGIYVLDPERRDELLPELIGTMLDTAGVDLVLWADGGEAVVASERGEVRFSPGGPLQDVRGGRWSVAGDYAALALESAHGGVWSDEYPDALARVWSAVTCATAGDLLLSPLPGFEFTDWGGADHVGGGSHGSLHGSDSLGVLLWCGTGPDRREARPQWTLRDVAPMVRQHFGVGV